MIVKGCHKIKKNKTSYMKKERSKRRKQRRLTTKIRLLFYFGAKTFESLSYAIMSMMFPRRQNKLQGLSI